MAVAKDAGSVSENVEGRVRAESGAPWPFQACCDNEGGARAPVGPLLRLS